MRIVTVSCRLLGLVRFVGDSLCLVDLMELFVIFCQWRNHFPDACASQEVPDYGFTANVCSPFVDLTADNSTCPVTLWTEGSRVAFFNQLRHTQDNLAHIARHERCRNLLLAPSHPEPHRSVALVPKLLFIRSYQLWIFVCVTLSISIQRGGDACTTAPLSTSIVPDRDLSLPPAAAFMALIHCPSSS